MMNVFLKTEMITFGLFNFWKDMRIKGVFTIDDHSKVFPYSFKLFIVKFI